MKRLQSICVVICFNLLCSSTNGQNCTCTINQVETNTVSSCPITYGSTTLVSNVTELRNAINLANSTGGNMTILIQDGTYPIASSSWYPYITASKVVFRSQSGNRNSVTLTGTGMSSVSPGVENVLYIVGDSVVIADLTIKDVGNHGIACQGDYLLVHNVRIQDTYEQMLKGTSAGDGSDHSIVQCSLFEYTAGVGPQYYIGGLDIHEGNNWEVRDNVFKGIASPSLTQAEHAIHFWNFSADNLIERNIIINCDRGIGFGLGSSPNSGGVIKNNMIYNDGSGLFDDVGIGLETSPGTKVFNNTIHIQYPNAIEYRYTATNNVEISNNLTNKVIKSRNGGSASLLTNETNALDNWFVDVLGGNLRLKNTNNIQVVDVGSNIVDVVQDIDQNSRPQGNKIDLGAHELPQSSCLPLIQISDLTYQGAFIIPGSTYGESNANYAAGAIAYNGVNHSIFVAGHRVHAAVAEFLIPTLVNSRDVTELNSATVLQDFKRVLDLAPGGNPQSINEISGLQLIGNRLFVNAVEYYDAPADNTHTTLVVEDASQLNAPSISGYYSLQGGAHIAGWMSPVPNEWQQQLGGEHIAGNSSRYPINGRHSMGPSAFVFDPGLLVNNTSNILSTTSLLDFSLVHPLYTDFSSYDDGNYNILELNGSTFSGHTFEDAMATVGENHLWTEESEASYGIIIPGTSTYMTIGSSGGHYSGIGYKPTQNNGNLCGGPCPYDASDRYNYYWLWDMNDLVEVKNGNMNPYDVRPYAYGEFDAPFQFDAYQGVSEFHPIVGGTYDESSGTLYLTIYDAGPINSPYARNPVIAAYKINSLLPEETCDGIDNNGDGQVDENLTNMWVGPVNGNWYDNTNNWSLCHFPNSCNKVIIDANCTVTIKDSNVGWGHSLELQPGASVIIESNASLSVVKSN